MTDLERNRNTTTGLGKGNNAMENDSDQTPNVNFYQQKRRITKYSLSIVDIYLKEKDYDWFEECHDYIQWLFPTCQQSRYNQNSFPLSQKQVQIFCASKSLGQKILKSFQIYCDFMGVKVNSKKRQFSIESHDRAINALALFTHNHLRIKRIFNCLLSTGLKPVAFWFVEILSALVNSSKVLNKNKEVTQALQNQWKEYSFQRLSKFSLHNNPKNFEKLNPVLSDYSPFRKIQQQQMMQERTSRHKQLYQTTNDMKSRNEEIKNNLMSSCFNEENSENLYNPSTSRTLQSKIKISENPNKIQTKAPSKKIKQKQVFIDSDDQNDIIIKNNNPKITQMARIRSSFNIPQTTTYNSNNTNNFHNKSIKHDKDSNLNKTITSKSTKPSSKNIDQLLQCFAKK